MTEEQPGFAERDDDEFSAPTGGGAEWEDGEELDLDDLEEDDPPPDQGADWDEPADA